MDSLSELQFKSLLVDMEEVVRKGINDSQVDPNISRFKSGELSFDIAGQVNIDILALNRIFSELIIRHPDLMTDESVKNRGDKVKIYEDYIDA